MKSGKTLTELAAELQRQAENKRDYLADTRALRLEPTPGATAPVTLQGVNGGMVLRPTAHGQMAAVLGIPKPYYDRMLSDAPDLLAANVNRWLGAQPARRLIRTLDGSVRAVLSDSYRPLDNFDLAEAVLPTLLGVEAEVISCEVTESRFYLKAVTRRVEGEVKPGDVIRAGLVVSNSEVGHGSLRVEALDYRLVCIPAGLHQRHDPRGGRAQGASGSVGGAWPGRDRGRPRVLPRRDPGGRRPGVLPQGHGRGGRHVRPGPVQRPAGPVQRGEQTPDRG
jgi:hypothetical protein